MTPRHENRCALHITPSLLAKDDPINTDNKIRGLQVEPRVCTKWPSTWTGFATGQGASLACAAANLLAANQIGQRQHAYSMLVEASEALNLHGFDEFKEYDAVFCGLAWQVVARRVVHDALINNRIDLATKNQARIALMILGIRGAIPVIEDALRQSNDQLDIVQLGRMWFSLRLSQVEQLEVPESLDVEEANRRLAQNQEKRTKAAVGLAEDLKQIIGDKGSVVERAIEYFEEETSECGGFCLEEGSQEKRWFNQPLRYCPPESVIKELRLEECPFRGA